MPVITCIYVIRTYRWLLHVSQFLACEFQVPMGTYLKHYSTLTMDPCFNTQLTTCDCSFISASRASYLGWVPPFPLPCSSLRISFANACLWARSEPLTPVVRMPTSMIPVFGSVADCFRASRCSLATAETRCTQFTTPASTCTV